MPRADRIAPRRRSAWLFGLAALVVAGAIGAALFGLPVRTWFEQDDQLQGLDHELSELQTVNNDLQNEVDRLQTDEGIIEAAREELGYVQAGDSRETMMPLPPLPRDLPDGWPYSQVDHILAVRAAAELSVASGPANAGEKPAEGDDGAGGWILPQVPTSAAAPIGSPTTVVSVAPDANATTMPPIATTIPGATTTSSTP